MRTVLLAAVSADGKIADSKGDQSMLTSKADRRHLRSYMESADLLILGRRTFEKHRVALLNYHCAVITSSVDGTVHVSKNQTLW
ncbi:MAG: hypothetical protein EBZ48_17040, partial [Proteobacteria bacterium]|nr:hypothetical protein [Pseudomonadota bacterium]